MKNYGDDGASNTGDASENNAKDQSQRKTCHKQDTGQREHSAARSKKLLQSGRLFLIVSVIVRNPFASIGPLKVADGKDIFTLVTTKISPRRAGTRDLGDI